MKYQRITIDGMPSQPKFVAEQYIKARGKAARRRAKSISDKLHEVHKPWHQRSTEDSVHDNGTILFDLT